MRQTKKDRYFAMYKGDKYVDGGTKEGEQQ